MLESFAVLILLCLLQEVVYYLVKWCSLPYEDSTWELKDDVDQNKIEEFEQLQAVKPDSRRVVSHAYRRSSLITVFPFSSFTLTLYKYLFVFFCCWYFEVLIREFLPFSGNSFFFLIMNICCSGIIGDNCTYKTHCWWN